ncbi:AAA family ATPase [Akkermansia muciniphila]|uniref:AAA family ATPase n=1 Tax=Akkermansia muciniphila TaxID=239935 RepID=UPI000FE34CC3|nr:AAA family ATPase [Akkermansia muciniphila]
MVKRDGRFFLQRPGQQPIEMSLVAEGFKRLGTLSYLIRNGSVKKGSVLFWDEPEMNLNASHLPVLVKTLTGLAKTGVQVILSSHSLFLLRELMIQLSEPRNAMVQRKFFGMSVPRGNVPG